MLKKITGTIKHYCQKAQDELITQKFIRNEILKENYDKYRKEVSDYQLIEKIKEEEENFHKIVKGKTYRDNNYSFGALPLKDGLSLYSLIRTHKPKILVETGVCNGVSSAFILLALKNNKSGSLYSIDFPEIEGMKYENGEFWEGKGGASIPKDKQPGWIIPKELKKNWNLILGKSQNELPKLLKKLKKIDYFMHDSEHSYECMTFEYETAFPFINENGFLISDDITWNKAFQDFCKSKDKTYKHISRNIAFIKK